MFSKLLSELNHDIIIFILLGNVLLIFNNPSIEENYSTKIFIKIARKLINSYFYLLYNKEKELMKRNNKDCSNYWLSNWKKENSEFIDCFEGSDDIFKIHLGAQVIEWLWDLDLLEFDYHRNEDKNNPQYLKASNKVSNLISETNNMPLNVPDKLPMLTKPKEYNKN